MRIQISDIKIVKDATVIWDQHGPEVDIVMDVKKLTFKPGSVTEIFAFHVLDHLFPHEIVEALSNWKQCLVPGGKIYMVVDDFEYIARAFVGGDIPIDLYNRDHAHPTQFTKDSLVQYLKNAGFKDDNCAIWFQDVPGLFPKKVYELVLDAKNE